jgi:predicted nucleic acid-binding protein
LILVDTSVWVEHLRKGDAMLARVLEEGRVLAHPFVIGEIALGSLKQRAVILDALKNLPQAVTVTDGEVLHFIEQSALSGRGIGYVDAHLLAATTLTSGASLWTYDKRLLTAADNLGVAFGQNP